MKKLETYLKEIGKGIDSSINFRLKDLENLGDSIVNYIGYDYFMTKPIGILKKEYGMAYLTLRRNVGNGIPTFLKGYSHPTTPIGLIGDPYYNMKYGSEDILFFNNKMKQKTANYLEYISALGEDGLNNINFITNNLFNTHDNDFIFAESDEDNSEIGLIGNKILPVLKSEMEASYKPRLLNNISNTGYEYLDAHGNIDCSDVIYSDDIKFTNKFDSNFIKSREDYIKTIKGTYLKKICEKHKEINDFFKNQLNNGYKLIQEKYNFAIFRKNNDDTEYSVRYIFNNIGNYTYKDKTYYYYNEHERNQDAPDVNKTYGDKRFETMQKETVSDIVEYTNNLFKQGQIDTLIGRFHSDSDVKNSLTNSATSKYGISHGRNLLTGGSENIHYHNPYCRVWTYHHQYSTLKDAIRPLSDEATKTLEKELRYYRPNDFGSRLRKYGVKGLNKLVKITPTYEIKDIQKCMFSIENLAWKGEKKLFEYHNLTRGPYGGRIMWFPPYDLKFSENVNVNWNSNQFIGRGENIYSYTNTERSGQLSFKLLIDHPSVINSHRHEVSNSGDVDDVDSTEQGLLRFFAGCDSLEGGDTPYLNQQGEKNNRAIQDSGRTDVDFSFFVFFPNNFSGTDDGAIYSLLYLINGFGTNKYILESGDIGDISIEDNLKYRYNGYEMDEKSVSQINNENFLGDGDEKNVEYFLNSKTFVTQNGKNKEKKEEIYRYGYRVDKDYQDQKLNKKNYYDSKTYNLNIKKGLAKIKSKFNIDENYQLYSFADVFTALAMPAYQNANINELLLNILGNNINTNDVEKLKKIFQNKDIKEIKIKGCASSHGYADKNKSLSRKRATTIKKWLDDCFKAIKKNNIKVVVEDDYKIGKLNKNNRDVNSEDAKLYRNARVDVILSNSTIYENNSQAQRSNSINFNKKNGDKIYKDENFNKDYPGYANEYRFFKELEVNEPFLHNKLVDKIKYFDPAFHSITPEGFQSRLTFLHQCTRQGNTNGSSDTEGNYTTANNLAFGRPPICVLRIGDFFYTKIIIDSLSINYNDTVWDLNDEGIGVMPMIADVNISFKFLGGSDISGPISRLQNALSFNHYGNTSIYDNRAEKGEEKNIGSKK